ncbi:MAG: HAD-IA family hydrolase [bacterium JZ-2024 1]
MGEGARIENRGREKRVIRGILFDLDGTLYDAPEYTQAFRRAVIRFAAGRLRKSEGYIRRLLQGAESAGRSLTQTLADAGLPKEEWHREMAKKRDLYRLIPRDPLVREVFRALAIQGFRVGIVTNASRPVAKALLQRIGVPCSDYRVLVTGSDSAPKPLPEPFLRASESLGVPPQEVAYVGDRALQEVIPAQRLGMMGILLQRVGRVSRAVHFRIPALTVLPSLMARICELPALPVVWISGRPAAGKSTVSRLLARLLRERGFRVALLDSDDLRAFLTGTPTYDDTEKTFVYRALFKMADVASRSGAVTIVAATGFRRELRREARALFPRYLEVYLQCPVEEAVRRDPKSLYAQALAGHISTLPGISLPYEEPQSPDLVIDTTRVSPERAARAIFARVLVL